jgi:hypothetical protein
LVVVEEAVLNKVEVEVLEHFYIIVLIQYLLVHIRLLLEEVVMEAPLEVDHLDLEALVVNHHLVL